MEFYAIALRAFAAYVFLMILVRLSGKRTIYQGTPLDFVVALIIGDMFDDLFWAEVPASQFIVAMGVLFLTHVGVGAAASASPKFARLVEGEAVPLIESGQLKPAQRRGERMNHTEVMAALREHEVADVREVKSAALEVSGQVSVLPEEWAKPAQKEDLERVRQRREEPS